MFGFPYDSVNVTTTSQSPSNMALQRLSPHKLLQLISSEKVKMYIGREEKLYLVPRELICYHSNTLRIHFDKKVCIRKERAFIKAKYEQNNAKHLWDCQPEHFDMLLECMMQGGISTRWTNSREAIKKCIALLEYSWKIDMVAMVCEAVVEPLTNAIKSPALQYPPIGFSVPRREVPHRGFTVEDIKTVFKVTRPGNVLRALVAQDVLSRQGLKGTAFKDVEDDVPGLAAEIMKQFRECVSFWAWTDPITGLQRTYDGYT
ncbi:hypothetical protein IFR05_014641 [Cadophora sp. M221]|nr:hypothetical protein IFR05_014641 [Cadophora sp. M221]